MLREVAARLREAIRQSDTAARVGGEFVVLLSEMALPSDGLVAARCDPSALPDGGWHAAHRRREHGRGGLPQ